MSRMLQWSEPVHLEAVPEEIRPKMPVAKGRGRYFVGRRRELDRLKERHNRDPKTTAEMETGSDRSFISAIHNPPGVGKSTLLEEFGREHRAQGGFVLQLGAKALRSKEALGRQIAEDPVVQQGWKLKAAGIIVDIAMTATGIGPLQALWKAAKAAGKALHHQMQTDTDAKVAIEMAAHGKDEDGIELLRVMGQATDGKTIIIVDEADSLGSTEWHDDTEDLLQKLGDPTHRTNLGLRSGGVILAGLVDLEERLAELSKSRIYGMPLHPLDGNAVTEMLKQAWQRGRYPGDKSVELRPEESKIIDTLAYDFGAWTHHAYSAAYATQDILTNLRERRARQFAKDKTPTPDPGTAELCRWIRSYAALGTCWLYDKIIRLSSNYVGPNGVQTISQEFQATGDVTDNTLQNLFNETRENRGLDSIGDMSNREAKEKLLHYGLLSRERDPEGNLTGRLTVPIPSLANYLKATNGKAARWTAEQIFGDPKARTEGYIEWESPPEE